MDFHVRQQFVVTFSVQDHQIHHVHLPFMSTISLRWKADSQIITREKLSQIHVDEAEDRVSQEDVDYRLTGEDEKLLKYIQILMQL